MIVFTQIKCSLVNVNPSANKTILKRRLWTSAVMASAFGFSASDFIAAIGLTVKISKARRETGGASTECSLVVQDLRTLQHILELLQQVRPALGNESLVNAIRGVAITCLVPLKEFSEKLERRYGPIAGSQLPRNFLRQTSKKVHWGVFTADEVAKFRAVIAAKVSRLELLLGFFNYESLARIETRNQEATNFLSTKIAEHQDSLERDMARIVVRHQRALSVGISDAQRCIKDDLSNFEARGTARHKDLLGRVDVHTRKLDDMGVCISQLQRDMHVNIREVVGLCFSAKAGTEQMFRSAHRRSDRLNDGMRSIRKEQEKTESQIISGFRSTFDQLRMISMIGASLLSNLVPFSGKILRYLRENMKNNLATYALLLKIQQEMPKQVANSDTIYFEDVLGRTENLPYVYFKHWEVLQSMIECHFKGVPGEKMVKHGANYMLINCSTFGIVGNELEWQQTVFPGTKMKMAIIIQRIRRNQGIQGRCVRQRLCNGRIGSPKEFKIGLSYVFSLGDYPVHSFPYPLRHLHYRGIPIMNLGERTLDNAGFGIPSSMDRAVFALRNEEWDHYPYRQEESREIMVFRTLFLLPGYLYWAPIYELG